MKKFAKKHLAIAVFMMAFGGMTNMAHAAPGPTAIFNQDVSADKTVKQAGAAKVEFTSTPGTLISGVQTEDVDVFKLKVSDVGGHFGWHLVPTGSSTGGFMYNDQGETVRLNARDWTWVNDLGYWLHNDSSAVELNESLFVAKGQALNPGVYHFTARVEEVSF